MASEPTLPIRVSLLEQQINRIALDMSEEKEMRIRRNDAIDDKHEEIRDGQKKTDRILSMMMGGLAVLNVVIQFLHH
jgi:hypothetical protein